LFCKPVIKAGGSNNGERTYVISYVGISLIKIFLKNDTAIFQNLQVFHPSRKHAGFTEKKLTKIIT